MEAEMMFEVCGPKEQISSVRYVIVFKSPSPGLSSQTNARETSLSELSPTEERVVPPRPKAENSLGKGKSSNTREHSDLEEPAHYKIKT